MYRSNYEWLATIANSSTRSKIIQLLVTGRNAAEAEQNALAVANLYVRGNPAELEIKTIAQRQPIQ